MPKSVLRRLLLALSAGALIGLSPVPDSPTLNGCDNGVCTLRLTAPQLLSAAEKAILAQRYDEARPMLAALSHAPELSMQRHFLLGYMAAQINDLRMAENEFRAVLRDRPEMTRARLELAQVLLREGKQAAADHHYRLAEEDSDLPPEVEQTIRQVRGYIRSRRNWTFNVNFGLAPDSNINSATGAQTVQIFGEQYSLSPDARRKSGIGQLAGANGSVRLRLKDGLALVVDANGQFINQPGGNADDLSALIAAGPELTLKNGARLAVQAVGYTRIYGGTVAQQGPGARMSYQQNLDKGQRVNALIDVRRIDSHYSPAYDGTSYSAYLTYERVIRHSLVASATIFGRRDDLKSKGYSDKEFGFNLGIGGELPKGINAGLSAGISRALFDDPILAFDPDSRKDWRFSGRANLGIRSVRVLGFSPSVTYTFSKISTSVPLYRSERHRVEFSLARYF